MIMMGNLGFLFCFSGVSLSHNPIISLLLVIYCSFLLGTTFNSCFQGMLMLVWILIYVGGMMVVFTYCIFFSKNMKKHKFCFKSEFLVLLVTVSLYSLTLKESWFIMGISSKINDNFIFNKSPLEISSLNDKSMFLFGENGIFLLFMFFSIITFVLLLTVLFIKELTGKQNLF